MRLYTYIYGVHSVQKSGARILGVRNQIYLDLNVSDAIYAEVGLLEMSAEISLSAQFSRDWAQSQIWARN